MRASGATFPHPSRHQRRNEPISSLASDHLAIAGELTAKLEQDVELEFERAPADLSMLGRTGKQFVEMGYSVAEAAALLGIPAPGGK